MNTVTHIGYLNSSNKSRDALLQINSIIVRANPEIVGYKNNDWNKPINHWTVYVRYDWNESNIVRIAAPTLQKLIDKLSKDNNKITAK